MNKLIRNPELVKTKLVVNPTKEVIVTEKCVIQIPVRFTTIGLGQIGLETNVYGCFVLVLDTGEYSVFNINAFVELSPSRTTIVDVNGVDYHQFEFEPYQVLFKTTTIVKRDSIIYKVFDEFIFKGKVPWYLTYDDVGKLFDTAKEYANSDVSKNQDVIEFLVSLISRSSNDRSVHIRNIIKSYKDTQNISYVPLSSVFYNVNNTLNKLAGSYFNHGVVSALVKPSDQISEIEKILRA